MLADIHYFDIWVGDVDDIPTTCASVWASLRQFSPCAVWLDILPKTCASDPQTRRTKVEFYTDTRCNARMVESAWSEATQDKFGALHC